MTVFASVLPGRIRLRHPLLRDAVRHRDLAARLRPLAVVDGNPVVGSLLLRFDPADPDAEARIRAEVAAVLPSTSVPAAPSPSPPRRKRKRSAKWDVNRIAKLGAVASLALSLAALGGSKRLHAQAGAVFVVLMAVHMAVHRRHLFR